MNLLLRETLDLAVAMHSHRRIGRRKFDNPRYTLWVMGLVIQTWWGYHQQLWRRRMYGSAVKRDTTYDLIERVLHRNERAKLGIVSRMDVTGIESESIGCWGVSHRLTKTEFLQQSLTLFDEKTKDWWTYTRHDFMILMGFNAIDPKQLGRGMLGGTS